MGKELLDQYLVGVHTDEDSGALGVALAVPHDSIFEEVVIDEEGTTTRMLLLPPDVARALGIGLFEALGEIRALTQIAKGMQDRAPRVLDVSEMNL